MRKWGKQEVHGEVLWWVLSYLVNADEEEESRWGPFSNDVNGMKYATKCLVSLAGRSDCLNARIVSGEYLEKMDRGEINDG